MEMPEKNEKAIQLMNLLEIMRAQPQYGYNVAGGNTRVGNLAEHHYLVAMIGWQLAEIARGAGAEIDANKVIRFCLLHDIGEIFGGDIGMYYAKANRKAYRLAKQFEEENQRFISRFFVNSRAVKESAKEILNSKSDEAHIAKIADYLEVSHYKLFNGMLKGKDIELVHPKLMEKVSKIKDEKARNSMKGFVELWIEKMSNIENFIDASTEALNV